MRSTFTHNSCVPRQCSHSKLKTSVLWIPNAFVHVESRQAKVRLVACPAAGDKANVLLLGGGGREHALAWKLSQSPQCGTLYCSPGNPGIAEELHVQTIPDLDSNSHPDLIKFCKESDVSLVFVGPEAPLVDGVVDSLSAAGIPTFGPTKAAAQLEGSKVFMKDICAKYNIPTAWHASFTNAAAARAFIKERGAPIVVKASGLAAGKGVTVATTVEEACEAVDSMLLGGAFGAAGECVVVEEFLEGEEASMFALVDGSIVVALGSAQDHKAVGEGDTGPNTGGMGAYSPAPVLTDEVTEEAMRDIVQRTADAMVSEGTPFRGVLFAGLMISKKDDHVKLLEHNVRFGDPECQGLLMRLKSDLLSVLLQATSGHLGDVTLEWSPEAALTVVLAAQGYPGPYNKGSKIGGLDGVEGAKVFHAGTTHGPGGEVLASGGRVLGVTALGEDVAEAQQRAYAAVDQIDWPEGFHRRDIGWRAVGRAKP